MNAGIRRFYSSDVVDRVLSAHGSMTQVAPNYQSIPGAIPLPATLSLELGSWPNCSNYRDCCFRKIEHDNRRR